MNVNTQSTAHDNLAPERLRESATLLFAEQGYAGTSMQMLMDHSGVNKALVYYYFDNKEGLLADILRDFFAELAPVFGELLNGQAPLAQRAAHFVTRYSEVLGANPLLPRIVQRELATQGPGLTMIKNNLAPLVSQAQNFAGRDFSAESNADEYAPLDLMLTLYSAIVGYFIHGPLLSEILDVDLFDPKRLQARQHHLLQLTEQLITSNSQ